MNKGKPLEPIATDNNNNNSLINDAGDTTISRDSLRSNTSDDEGVVLGGDHTLVEPFKPTASETLVEPFSRSTDETTLVESFTMEEEDEDLNGTRHLRQSLNRVGVC